MGESCCKSSENRWYIDEFSVQDHYKRRAMDPTASRQLRHHRRLLAGKPRQLSSTPRSRRPPLRTQTTKWLTTSSPPSATKPARAVAFFTTRNKYTIGLGHAEVRRGDIVAVLLGSAVPFILRISKHTGPSFCHSGENCWLMGCPREKHLRCCIPVLYTIIGQAFVRDCMWYKGDIERDIVEGILVLEEFFLE